MQTVIMSFPTPNLHFYAQILHFSTYALLGLDVLKKTDFARKLEVHPMKWTFVVGLENLDK